MNEGQNDLSRNNKNSYEVLIYAALMHKSMQKRPYEFRCKQISKSAAADWT